VKTAFLSYSISRAYGGIFEIARRTAQTLSERQGVDVSVLGIEDEFTRDDLAEWQPLQPRWFTSRGPRAYGFTSELAGALDDAKPDLVHVHGIWTFPTVAARQWARRHSRPYLVTIHGMLEPWALKNARWKKAVAGALFENAALQRANCLHVNTEAELRSIRAYGLRNPVCVIPNGVDLPDESINAPASWAGMIDSDAKVLLYLGRLHPKKGLPQLLSAWAAVRRSAPAQAGKWHLAIAGWDQAGHEARLQAQVKSAGMSDSVHFFGPLFGEAKAAAYHHADAFILPSFSEGLPMVVLEAWANRLPVLMTPQCNLPEGFALGASLRIESTSESIAQGLDKLFRLSAASRREMGECGRTLVTERFSWSNVATDLRRVYGWILGDDPKPECVTTEYASTQN
jgi:poly(glycerol-phosphate) alpha-glucosyltransferase